MLMYASSPVEELPLTQAAQNHAKESAPHDARLELRLRGANHTESGQEQPGLPPSPPLPHTATILFLLSKTSSSLLRPIAALHALFGRISSRTAYPNARKVPQLKAAALSAESQGQQHETPRNCGLDISFTAAALPSPLWHFGTRPKPPSRYIPAFTACLLISQPSKRW